MKVQQKYCEECIKGLYGCDIIYSHSNGQCTSFQPSFGFPLSNIMYRCKGVHKLITSGLMSEGKSVHWSYVFNSSKLLEVGLEI